MHTPVKKIALTGFATLLLATAYVSSAAAHVVVRPASVPTASFQTFTLSVPNERDQPNTTVKLVLPAGLQHVTPTVKQGWDIQIEKSGEGETATVASITWSGGQIPAELRDDFTFSAQAPAKAGDLQWKAYQTYADGTVAAWDQPAVSESAKDDDSAASGPFSVTEVTADDDSAALAASDSSAGAASRALYAAIAGIMLALAAIYLATRKKV